MCPPTQRARGGDLHPAGLVRRPRRRQRQHKINSAYNRGLSAAEQQLTAQGISGPELDRRGREAGRAALIATVEALTGTQIDHYAEINLAGSWS
jgi:anionic cell wall polymer biosynthesis LytR-Cps2A-Psr (LCP) family protein